MILPSDKYLTGIGEAPIPCYILNKPGLILREVFNMVISNKFWSRSGKESDGTKNPLS